MVVTLQRLLTSSRRAVSNESGRATTHAAVCRESSERNHVEESPTHSRLQPSPPLALLLSLALVACQSAGGDGSPGAQAGSTSPTASPSTTPQPVALPRPTDIPTDGTCEDDHVCLGLLGAGTTYHTKAFAPAITLRMPVAAWENLADEAAVFQLLPIGTPGDAIAFFRGARAVAADGSFAQVKATVDGLTTWLGSHELLHVTPAKRVTVGGLSGLTMDITIAPGAVSHPSDCPVQTCVTIFKGQDLSARPPWHWDWGSAGTETQRLYLLKATDGVVAIFVDSLDGTTFDTLTSSADRILAGVKFG